MRKSQAGEKEVAFLATTALEEFWDTTKPLVFLGEWCLLYDRRSFWQPLDAEFLESAFDNAEAAHAAYHCVDDIYERLLPLLGDALNTFHGKHYSQRYWRILLGPWLLIYLSVMYDRYASLKKALKKYPDCTTLVLAEGSFAAPSDTLDFARSVQEDIFNLRIYSRIFIELGKNFPCKEAKTVPPPMPDNLAGNSWGHKATGFLTKICAGVGARVFRSTLLRSSYFPRASELGLSLKTSGKVLPLVGRLTQTGYPSYDERVRENIKSIWLGDGEFERCLSALLSSDIPDCFVEGYAYMNGEALKAYPKNPKAIFSANAWYFDEAFKQWAAASAEKGTLLVGTQHGGNYGGLAISPSEKHEMEVVDRYYSWGWERTDCAAEVIPFFATKLVGRKKIGASNLKKGILWAGTSTIRYLFQLPELPEYFREYLAWQRRFARALSPSLLGALRFRSHRVEGGLGTVRRLLECIPSLHIETWDVPFLESLANCRLYVCDHLSTTFTEALAANKPTILFWNPEANRLRPEAQAYYDLLQKNGILFDTPESAGEAVNKVYDDVESWWNEPERQNAVEKFCERFARNSPDALELWADEFKRIAALPGLKVNRVI